MKILSKINEILILLFLLIAPFLFTINNEKAITLSLVSLIIINLLGLILYIKKPFKIDKKIILYLIFILTYFIPLFTNIIHFNKHLINAIIILLLFLLALNINNNLDKNKLNKTIIITSLITSIISMFYTFYPQFFNKFNIIGDYGDYYISSIYRLYGIFNYPNILAVSSLIGIILCFKYKNKLIYNIIIYINLLTLLLTISKMILIFTLIITIISIILDRKKLWPYIASIFPLFINLNLYRISVINNQLLIFIIGTIILIVLYYLILKHKLLILIFIPILIIFPYKNLTLENSNKNLILADFFNLNEKTYKITFDVEGKNIEGKINLNKHSLVGIEMNYYVIKTETLNKKTTLTFKTTKDAQFYTITINNIGSKIKISNMKLISKNNKKDIHLDYTILPYNYVKSLEQTQYDVGSVSGRIDIYKDCINIIKDNPLGSGYDYFRYHTLKNNIPHHALTEHSYIFTLGVQNGIISLVLWLILIIIIIINSIRALDKNTINYVLITFLLIYSSTFDLLFTNSYFILILLIYSLTLLNNKSKDIMYISSSGGHQSAINKIIKNIKNDNHITIIEGKQLLTISRKNIIKYILLLPINIILNIIYFIHYNPKIIISTGAHTGVFMCYLGKICKKKIVFIEVIDSVKELTLSGKIVYKIADTFIIQNKNLLKKYPKAKYIGEMY